LVFAISLVVLFIAVICFAFNAAHRAAKTKPALDTRWWQSTFTIFVVSLAINLVAEVTMPFRWRTFSVPSGSDLPTILPGESFVADVRPETQNLLRGRMIVFHPPGSRLSYVKRVVGVQGDRIQIQNGQLYINGRAVERQDLPLWQWNNGTGEAVSLHHYRETIPGAPPYEIVKYSDDARIDIGTGIDANNTPEFTVPENALFVLGDNRDNSLDSRFPAVGYVPVSNVVGVAGVIYWSGVNARIGTSIN
jgi:signal peptidase I